MTPPDDATRAQIRAADPSASSWVSANAGSGKTRVLTDRVARLLLRGTDPAAILCLTYTKAAAAEMQNRLFARLGNWAMLPDDDLREALGQLGEAGQAIEAAQLRAARTLFARALETPGGLRIQTIHSFCEQLLRRFPLEAGVAPGFEVLDERQAAQIRGELLEELADDPESGFTELAPHILGQEADLDRLLEEILRHRDGFAGSLDPAAVIRAVGGGDVELDEPAEILAALPEAEMDRLLSGIETAGGKDEQKCAAAIAAVKGGEAGAVDNVMAAFLVPSRDWDVRTHNLGTKKLLAVTPDAADLLARVADVVREVRQTHLKRRIYLQSMALGRFARSFLRAYEARKQAIGRLDFDDLIDLARDLLMRSDAGPWVRYKLDGGIDHVLVDEAQDTSPAQWQVIDALTAEFFVGSGARNAVRTIFVVGDRKQSIYSFQGADPSAFEGQSIRYSRALEDVREVLEFCELDFSFRSAAPILELVDAVFAENPDERIGQDVGHRAFKSDLPGRVELWPYLTKEEDPEESAWDDPVDHRPPTAPPLRVARAVAARITDILASGQRLPGTDRAVGAGDFLILVQRRGTLFHAIIRELKAQGLPVAGADRLKVGEQLAVRDLLSLLRFLVTPDDDLSLAEALRSPLVGISEGGLFDMAHARDGTLYSALRAKSDTYPAASAMLRDLRGQVDFLRPYEMLQRILTGHGARKRIRARLGTEADEAVDALLELALSYEQVEPPTMTGFLDWMASGDPEIKRQLDRSGGEIRVMTVHGAKGLEAPVVILPDTVRARNRSRSAPLTRIAPDLTAFCPRKDEQTESIRRAEATRDALEAEENWRLLYVAMTRAETWLMIAGGGADAAVRGSWYEAVGAAFDRLGAETDADGRLIRQSADWPGPAAPQAVETGAVDVLPGWLSEPAPPPPAVAEPLAPSRLAEDVEAAVHGGIGQGREAALLRGTQIHLLLERLPLVVEADRSDAARSLLDPEPTEVVADLVAEASGVLGDPDLSWIFAPGSLSEVPMAGRVKALGGRVLRGQIDRLITTGDAVWAIDFKTNPIVPSRPVDIPPAYVLQLALYHAGLSEVFPDRTIRTAILWTRTAQFMEISQDDVSRALQDAIVH